MKIKYENEILTIGEVCFNLADLSETKSDDEKILFLTNFFEDKLYDLEDTFEYENMLIDYAELVMYDNALLIKVFEMIPADKIPAWSSDITK